jgi:type II secretion system protein N
MNLNPRLQRLLPYVGYPLFYVAAFVFFAYVTAPYDRIKNAIVTGFNTGDSPLRLSIEDLSWSWRFPGISAEGVRLIGPEGVPGADGKTPPRAEYPIEDLYVRVSLLPLLIGDLDVTFGLDGFGGGISGYAGDSGDSRVIEMEFDGVSAAEFPYLADMVGLPLAGYLNGELRLELPDGKYSEANGVVDLTLSELVVGDGKAKIRDTIALPTLNVGVLAVKANAEEGRLEIEELSASGGDLELVSDGKVRLVDRVESSLIEANLRFRFSDEYKTQNDVTKGLFGEPGSKVPGVFDLDPKIRQAKRSDGFYGWHLTGPLSRINFQPAAADDPSRTPAKRTSRPTRPPTLRGFAQSAADKARAAREHLQADRPAPVPPPPPVPEPPPPEPPPPPPIQPAPPQIPPPPPPPPPPPVVPDQEEEEEEEDLAEDEEEDEEDVEGE